MEGVDYLQILTSYPATIERHVAQFYIGEST